MHTLSATALAIFGLLVFVDPWFALLAIGSYVLPPVVLFAVGWRPADDGRSDDAETVRDRSSTTDAGTGRRDDGRSVSTTGLDVPRKTEFGDDVPVAGSDRHDGDTDSDRDDGDTDSDTDR